MTSHSNTKLIAFVVALSGVGMILSLWLVFATASTSKASGVTLLNPAPALASQTAPRKRRIPKRLKQATAFSNGGGGYMIVPTLPPSVCDEVLMPTDSEGVWFVSSAPLYVELVPLAIPEQPYVEFCGKGDAPNAEINAINEEAEPIRFDRDPYHLDRYVFSAAERREFLPAGIYTVEIHEASGKIFTRTLTTDYPDYLAEIYQGPGFYLRDDSTGQTKFDFTAGETMRIEYIQYPPSSEIEVGLYQVDPHDFGSRWVLADSWVVQVDESGRYSESYPIPTDVISDTYVVAAVALNPFQNYLSGVLAGEIIGAVNRGEYYYHVALHVTNPLNPEPPEARYAPCIYKAKLLYETPKDIPGVFRPGEVFVKTWVIRNDSNCSWGPYQNLHSLVFVDGEQMEADQQVPLPSTVPPGQTVALSVQMMAPTEQGSYGGYWKLGGETDSREELQVGVTGWNGREYPLWVQVNVR